MEKEMYLLKVEVYPENDKCLVLSGWAILSRKEKKDWEVLKNFIIKEHANFDYHISDTISVNVKEALESVTIQPIGREDGVATLNTLSEVSHGHLALLLEPVELDDYFADYREGMGY